MNILFDQGAPGPLRRMLLGHVVVTAEEAGWDTLENGDLLRAAEGQHDLFVTTDQNVRYQQNVVGRSIAILVLMTTNWPVIQLHAGRVVAAVDAIQPGEYRELDFPRPPRRGRGPASP